MPKLLFARPPKDAREEHQLRKLAGSRHAPGDWIQRARMIAGSWDGLRTTAIAAELGCHPQTVRERIVRFNAEGIDGLGDRPGSGRKPRLTEQERGALIALACAVPPGKLVRLGDELAAVEPEQDAQWSLDALARAAQEQGIQVGRSQIRRILLQEGVGWRHPRTWAESTDPEFVPKERGSSPAPPPRRRGRRSSASTNSDR
ncbi:helix-turn-helix domain-containing protein [Nitrolancea hollandica]|uniref:Transposase n=1 Tax=Nitrolancea hollandica Lb TaxID=1129897 RepID=I4EKZ1_9BACT|nr:helix-turn-helix domain-containing protein [Nitrolancea hollandica]CCF85353.1 transposase [Nitrolancea hollandica Lb]